MKHECAMSATIDAGEFGEIDVDVKYFLWPGSPGQYSGRPENCYEAEPDETDVASVYLVRPCDSTNSEALFDLLGGKDIMCLLSEECLERLNVAAYEHATHNVDWDGGADHAESTWDRD